MKKIISASLIGQTHQQMYLNNQDAYKVINDNNFIVGVVCDGCGSCKDSEIGAKLTAEFVANYCYEKFRFKKFNGIELTNAITKYYEEIAKISLAPNKKTFINDVFFATIIGVIVSDKQTIVFWAGDGVVVVDDTIEVIEQDNAPDYLTHNLLSGKKYGFSERVITHKFDRILISTDGIEDIWENADANDVINTLFSDNFFEKEVLLSKFLSESNIYDDTTMILIKNT